MDNLFIEVELLGKDPDKIAEVGEVVARYELDNDERHLCLEVNGDGEDYYLEIVDYRVTENGDYIDQGFSDPIYFEDVPKNEEELMELFNDWLSQD